MNKFKDNLYPLLIVIGTSYSLLLITYIVVFQDKLFIAIITSLGTLLAQRSVENFKNGKKQQELARLVISLIESRNQELVLLQKHIIPDNADAEVKGVIIMRCVDLVKQDETYKSILKDIGIFPLNILKRFSLYDSSLKSAINILESYRVYSSEPGLDDSVFQRYSSYTITSSAIKGALTTMLISKHVLKDENQFQADKLFLVDEYKKLASELINALPKAKNTVTNNQDVEIINRIIFNNFIEIRIVFAELNISNELPMFPALENEEDTQTSL